VNTMGVCIKRVREYWTLKAFDDDVVLCVAGVLEATLRWRKVSHSSSLEMEVTTVDIHPEHLRLTFLYTTSRSLNAP
jgi:hypothetical protein